MRYWLLAIGLVIGSIGWQETFADDSAPDGARASDPETQATLSALKAAVKVPPRRASASAAGRRGPIVRLARPSPYALVKSGRVPASLDELPTRLVSHSEADALPAVSISEEMPEAERSAVRQAAALDPTPLGDLEGEPAAPAAPPMAAMEPKPLEQQPPEAAPAVAQLIPPAEPSTITFEAPARLPAEPATTIALKASAEPAKRISSRAGGGFTTNPLRQSSASGFSSRDISNPLR